MEAELSVGGLGGAEITLFWWVMTSVVSVYYWLYFTDFTDFFLFLLNFTFTDFYFTDLILAKFYWLLLYRLHI